MKGSLRPGVRLEDICYGFAFHNRITEWPSPYLCTSEAQEEEKEASKREKKRYDDEKDNKKKMRRPQAPIDTRLELLEALQRRGLALHLAGLMKFKHHEIWTARIKDALDPMNIAGHVSVSSAIKADQQLWQILKKECAKGVRKEYQDGETKYPLYEAMVANMDKYLVDRLLLPTHGLESKKTTTRKGGRASSTSSSSSSTSTRKKQKSRRKNTKRTTYTPTKGNWWKGKGKGKVKGKGKRTYSKGYGKGKGWGKSKKGKKGWGKRKGTPLPKELQGLNPNTKAGDPKCIGWNMPSGCNQAPGGQHCWKGLHVCMKCGSSTHGAHACKEKDKK
jgi:hypothetical protein